MIDTRINKKEWSKDGYSWSNRGKTRNKKWEVDKRYFYINNRPNTMSSRFRKEVCTLKNNSDYVLVHYLGDKTAYIPSSSAECQPLPSIESVFRSENVTEQPEFGQVGWKTL